MRELMQFGGLDPQSHFALSVIDAEDGFDNYLYLLADGHQIRNFSEIEDILDELIRESEHRASDTKKALLKWASELVAWADQLDILNPDQTRGYRTRIKNRVVPELGAKGEKNNAKR